MLNELDSIFSFLHLQTEDRHYIPLKLDAFALEILCHNRNMDDFDLDGVLDSVIEELSSDGTCHGSDSDVKDLSIVMHHQAGVQQESLIKEIPSGYTPAPAA